MKKPILNQVTEGLTMNIFQAGAFLLPILKIQRIWTFGTMKLVENMEKRQNPEKIYLRD